MADPRAGRWRTDGVLIIIALVIGPPVWMAVELVLSLATGNASLPTLAAMPHWLARGWTIGAAPAIVAALAYAAIRPRLTGRTTVWVAALFGACSATLTYGVAIAFCGIASEPVGLLGAVLGGEAAGLATAALAVSLAPGEVD